MADTTLSLNGRDISLQRNVRVLKLIDDLGGPIAVINKIDAPSLHFGTIVALICAASKEPAAKIEADIAEVGTIAVASTLAGFVVLAVNGGKTPETDQADKAEAQGEE